MVWKASHHRVSRERYFWKSIVLCLVQKSCGSIFKKGNFREMKNKKVIALIMVAAASCSSAYAATLPTSEVDAYILAMNTMSPITAKYTIQYKQAVEQKCNTCLLYTSPSPRD